MSRWVRRAVGLAVGVGALLLAAPAPAVAHPTLLFTEPAAETAVAEAPAAVSLVFGEAVTIGGRALTLVDAAGSQVPVHEARTVRDGRMVTARLDTPLAAGTYRVRWRVTGQDGDLVEGEYRFAVGVALSGAGPIATGPGVSWPTVPLRWVLFAGLAVALGGIVAERFTRSARAEDPALPVVRSWAGLGAVAGLAAVAGSAALLITDTGAVEVVWRERPGQVLLAEAAGFAAALLVIALGRAGWAVVLLAVVAVAEGVRAHANTSAPGWGAVATALHLAAAAVWVGALVHTVRAAIRWRSRAPAVRWVVFGYARLAVWVFLIVVATGTVTALLVLPLSAVTTTTYGRVLLIKLGLVAMAAALALTARLVLHRPQRLTRLRRSTRAEALVLTGVLAVTAVLVSTPTPSAGGQAAPPPPPRGVAVPVGGLAGQIGVYLTASDDQLVVRLTTPRRGDYYDTPPAQDYHLSGRLVPAGQEPADIRFRSCGPGCFLATTNWRDGDNVVSLRAAAPGWRGGTLAALVPWPAQSAGDLVARTAAIMRGQHTIAVHEAVTSDTTTGLPEPRPLLVDGTWFAANVPYGSGIAPLAARISRGPGPIRLALGFPAEARTAELTLDPKGRVAEETLTDGKHLVRHRFLYPD